MIDAQVPIRYRGIVSVTTLDSRGLPLKEKVIHNNGVSNLFKLLCEVISGKVSNIKLLNARLPKFLAVGGPSNASPTTPAMRQLQDTTEMNVQTRFPLISGQSYYIDAIGGVYAQFSCNIPQTSIGERTIYEMGLFASGEQNTPDMLARIIYEEGIKIEDGQSLLINWKIYFN